jgi:hypothetical protein
MADLWTSGRWSHDCYLSFNVLSPRNYFFYIWRDWNKNISLCLRIKQTTDISVVFKCQVDPSSLWTSVNLPFISVYSTCRWSQSRSWCLVTIIIASSQGHRHVFMQLYENKIRPRFPGCSLRQKESKVHAENPMEIIAQCQIWVSYTIDDKRSSSSTVQKVVVPGPI